MRTLSRLSVTIGIMGGLAASTASADEMLAATLHQLTKDHAAAYDREDVEATLRLVHTRSPEYEATRSVLEAQFSAQDLETEVVSFQYIGHDDEFAYARVRLKTSDTTADFADNTVDSVTLYHREDGTWKVWSDFILGIDVIEDD